MVSVPLRFACCHEKHRKLQAATRHFCTPEFVSRLHGKQRQSESASIFRERSRRLAVLRNCQSSDYGKQQINKKRVLKLELAFKI